MSDSYDSTDPARSRGFLIAAAVVLLLVVVGAVVVLANLLGGDETAPTPPGGEATSTGTTEEPADPDASICGLPGHETQGTLNRPPERSTWELVGTVAVPKSEAAGPGVTKEWGLRYCYAHTPEGAVMMAANTMAWGEALKHDAVAVAEHSVAAGPGYEAALQMAKEGTAAGDQPQSSMIQIRGFRLLSYDGKTALVDLAVQGSSGGYAHLPFELVWEKNDWRLRLMPDGSLPQGTGLPDLTEYIPWAGA